MPPMQIWFICTVRGEMLAISDVGRIRKPIVWTLHDMWAFAGGALHHRSPLAGWLVHNRPAHESGSTLTGIPGNVNVNIGAGLCKCMPWRVAC